MVHRFPAQTESQCHPETATYVKKASGVELLFVSVADSLAGDEGVERALGQSICEIVAAFHTQFRKTLISHVIASNWR